MKTEERKQLLLKMKSAIQELNKVKNQNDAVALMHYIGNISDIINLGNEENQFFKDIAGFRNFFNYISKCNDEMLKKFVKDKEFHQEFIGDTISIVEKRMNDIEDFRTVSDNYLDEMEFYAIFYEFICQYNLGYLFDELLDNNNIHNIESRNDSNVLGFSIFNPINHDSDIFIGDFKYDIHSMLVLAHEFGHVYDFKHFTNSSKEYNKYFYQSFFSEVFSKIFERLLLDFLINNNILIDDAKNKLSELELLNYDFLIASYVLSLLNDEVLLNEEYINLSTEELFQFVERFFKSKSSLKTFIDNSSNFDVLEDLSYAYGDIISMHLKEEIKNNGFSSEKIKDFMSKRSNIFQSDYLIDWEMSREKYRELYERETEFIKRR